MAAASPPGTRSPHLGWRAGGGARPTAPGTALTSSPHLCCTAGSGSCRKCSPVRPSESTPCHLRKEMKFCRGQPRGPSSGQWEGAHTAACRAHVVSILRLLASEGSGEHRPPAPPLLGCSALVQGSQHTPLQAPGRRPRLGDARGSHGSLTYSLSHCLPASAGWCPAHTGMISAHHQPVGGRGSATAQEREPQGRVHSAPWASGQDLAPGPHVPVHHSPASGPATSTQTGHPRGQSLAPKP